MKVDSELGAMLMRFSKGRRVKYPLYINKRFLETSISELNLDTRGNNALRRYGYETIGDILKRENSLAEMRNVGKKTIDIIMTSLVAYQYSILTDAQKEKYLERIEELNKED